MGKKNKIIKKKKGERETIEKISCLVKTIGTCLKKQSRAGNSRRNVSSGSHRIGTQSFLWQINQLQEPNVFRNSLSSGSCLLLKLFIKAFVKHCEAWNHSKCNQLDKAVSILIQPLVLTNLVIESSVEKKPQAACCMAGGHGLGCYMQAKWFSHSAKMQRPKGKSCSQICRTDLISPNL